MVGLVLVKQHRLVTFPVALGVSLVLCCVALTLHRLRQGALRSHYPETFCRDHVQVVVAVQSAPDNFRQRMAIRKTLGNSAVTRILPWRVLFYTTPPRKELIQVMRSELAKEDLLVTQGKDNVTSFLDMAHWVSERCGTWLRYLVHINDTTFADLVALHEYTLRLPSDDSDFHCQVEAMVRVERDPSHPDYIPETVFRDNIFPNHCHGSAFIVPGRFLEPLVYASRSIPPYQAFGPYLTGHLPVLARLGHTDVRSRMNNTVNGVWTERKFFTGGFNDTDMWKRHWLKTLVCFKDNENTTSTLTQSIVRSIQLGVVD
ncbi:beta-1,3-galactosyltransferase 9-like [Ornithodoros turicata]|uniref:beta-1,3-galactosyltransferase 9-like n=1 Tax=Ornithodoros turicata TaxID=34597 RepID=UPI0031386542